ncbi:hypothetical protein [Streptomyces lunaelactis]|uniref:hypothetical protein n=1 Tax=Streptomyces lunaelactis TaxID=1535768 RepID=UPI001585568B|nr:hypothetical protein [Streptomyces lunaelactis]NUK25995.1 hypothetical protein [Streptomyces lunaelactis]
MNDIGWFDQLLGGGEGGNSGAAIPVGGMSGLWSLMLSHYFAQVPGPLGPVLTTYFTSGVNFDDPSELGEAKSMLDAASPQQSVAADQMPGDSTNTRGELQQTVAYGQVAVDEPMGVANREIGQVDQATGIAEQNAGSSRSAGFGIVPDGADGVRRLEILDRGGSIPAPDVGGTTAERRLLGTPTGQPDQAEAARRTRPESALPTRPETVAAPTVHPSSAMYGGRDPSGNEFIILGTPLPASKPEQTYGPPRPADGVAEVQVHGVRPPPQGDSVAEVYIHGVRPPRPPQTPPPRPENSPDTEDARERGFWNRGGTGLVLGALTAAGGAVIILSNPVGWVVGLTGALMLASGTAASLSSGVELGASYAGKTMAEQDVAMNRATSAALGTSSPGGLLGGVAGTVYSGDSRGFEEGAFWGGLAEGVGSLGTGVGRMGARELRFGSPRNMNWNRTVAGEMSARGRNQQVYELGDVAARSRPNPLFPRSAERVELSHFLPRSPTNDPSSLPARLRRVIGPRRYERIVNRPFNLTPMWGSEHALIDPARYQFMKSPFKQLYPQLTGPARWARFTPPWLVQSAYGSGRVGLATGEDFLSADTDSDTEGVSAPPD